MRTDACSAVCMHTSAKPCLKDVLHSAAETPCHTCDTFMVAPPMMWLTAMRNLLQVQVTDRGGRSPGQKKQLQLCTHRPQMRNGMARRPYAAALAASLRVGGGLQGFIGRTPAWSKTIHCAPGRNTRWYDGSAAACGPASSLMRSREVTIHLTADGVRNECGADKVGAEVAQASPSQHSTA